MESVKRVGCSLAIQEVQLVAGAGEEWALQRVAGRYWSPPLVGMVGGASPVRLEMAHQWAWYQRFCSLQPPAFLRVRKLSTNVLYENMCIPTPARTVSEGKTANLSAH